MIFWGLLYAFTHIIYILTICNFNKCHTIIWFTYTHNWGKENITCHARPHRGLHSETMWTIEDYERQAVNFTYPVLGVMHYAFPINVRKESLHLHWGEEEVIKIGNCHFIVRFLELPLYVIQWGDFVIGASNVLILPDVKALHNIGLHIHNKELSLSKYQ